MKPPNRLRPPEALALMLALWAALCSVGCSSSDHGPMGELYQSTAFFDANAFVERDGRYRYEDGDVVVDKTGVDVSDHQGEIDWGAVAADGIDFAFIRVGYRGTTEGGLFLDEHFTSNLVAAREAGIECGAYFFSQATTVEEALEEAAFVLEVLGGTPLEYPVAFDYEVVSGTRIEGVDAQTASEIANAFCSAIRAGGYEPMMYGNGYDLERFDYHWVADYPVWYAEYGSSPSYERRLAIWQYTSEGLVDGIGSGVDLNLDLSDVVGAE